MENSADIKCQWLLLLPLIAVFKINAQSTGGIEEAKQHYQKAVAAIAKSDWSRAKTE